MRLNSAARDFYEERLFHQLVHNCSRRIVKTKCLSWLKMAVWIETKFSRTRADRVNPALSRQRDIKRPVLGLPKTNRIQRPLIGPKMIRYAHGMD